MLTNAIIKAAGPRSSAYKIADERGLVLHVSPTGHRSWRLRFRWKGAEQLLTFGNWPDVSLADARSKRDAARDRLKRGIDPRTAMANCEKAQDRNFEAAARAWHAHLAPDWSPAHAADVIASLERDVIPMIGSAQLAAIARPDILALLRKIERRGNIETARRLRQRISAIFRFAMSEGWTEADPAAVIGGALQRSRSQRRMPALTTITDARALMIAVCGLDAPPVVKLGHQLLALTAVRMSSLRGAQWSEFEGLDGPDPIWRIPAARMKLSAARKASADHDHIVPLSRRAIATLVALRHFAHDELVLPGRSTGKPIGEKAIGDLYVNAGFGGRHVPHGWRATFSTVMNEARPEDRSMIDAALGHALKGDDGRAAKVEGAYNRALHLDRRRDLFEVWGEMLFADAAASPLRGG